MLIKCSECGKQVSDKADSCPNCGMPMTAVQQRGECENKKENVTTQQTNKQYKASGCLGALLFVSGAIIFATTQSPASWILILGGIGFGVYAKIGKWWNND